MRTYQPVSCAFHDVLERAALRRRAITVVFADADGKVLSTVAVIDDVFAKAGVEFIRLGSGETIRLDSLRTVHGTKAS